MSLAPRSWLTTARKSRKPQGVKCRCRSFQVGSGLSLIHTSLMDLNLVRTSNFNWNLMYHMDKNYEITISSRSVIEIFSLSTYWKKIMTCRRPIIRLEILYKYRQLLRSTIVQWVSLPCLLLGEVIEMTDSLIFIAQRAGICYIVQTRKYRAHCDRSIKDGRQNATIVVSLIKFDMISLSLRYFQVPFDWNNMSIYVVKYFSCRHRHDFLMSMTCQHNCMSVTALIFSSHD